jgi:hypothetical protein
MKLELICMPKDLISKMHEKMIFYSRSVPNCCNQLIFLCMFPFQFNWFSIQAQLIFYSRLVPNSCNQLIFLCMLYYFFSRSVYFMQLEVILRISNAEQKKTCKTIKWLKKGRSEWHLFLDEANITSFLCRWNFIENAIWLLLLLFKDIFILPSSWRIKPCLCFL